MTLMFAPTASVPTPVTGARATVIALHGSASAPSQWRHLVAELEADFEVMTPVLPGYGADTLPVHSPRTLEQIAHDVIDGLGRCHTPVHLVGHSFGGAVALKIASLVPEMVLSLTLIEPAAFNLVWNMSGISTPKTEGFNQAVRVSRNALQGGDPARAMQVFMDFWNGPGFWERTDPDRRATMTKCAPKIHNDFVALVSDRFLAAEAARVTCPILCISGDQSPPEIHEVTTALSDLIAQTQHEIVAGAGHMVPITHPETVNPLVSAFLAKTSCECQKYKRAA
ncbi:alpha/beta hydrolase [uncultured Roseobacter sp.]|uniref:alpha/beta fold hydrolase n=1 Tax=uncultured Roseobacter sp. TaxID=114847 RepID=UPI002622F882|nr:alpha/beta hydrolase [uncultured Roseobacter sp.]